MKRWISLCLIVGSLLLVASVQAATGPVNIPAGWEKINGAKYPTKAAQQAVYTNIFVANNALYGRPRIAAKAAPVKAKYNSREDQAIVKAALDFVKTNLVDASTQVAITISGKYNSLYFLDINLTENGTMRTVKSAMTADKKFFLPSVMDMTEVVKTNQAATADTAAPAAELVKSDKPVVEVFVMTYCPYGTQIEKGLLPVIKTLGDQADIQIKFVSYTMHGAKEFEENLTQYCINKEQSDKFWPYLECFLKEADSSACLASNNIDTAKVTACTAAATEQYQLVSTSTNFPIYKDANVKYGVQGSPTLVINGAEVNSGRDSASLLKTICSAFNTPPAECSTILSSATPAPGFGTGTTNNSTPASCN